MVTAAPPGDGLCAWLARRLREDELATPGPDLLDVASRRVFDTLGALLVGARIPGPVAPPAGPLDGTLERVRRLCAITRRSEIDDIDPLGLVTPGAVVVPAALALADATAADGPAVLAAVIAGYEAMVAGGELLGGAGLLARGVWPTYLLAPLATAAVAASLQGLDESRTTHALALALARAAGVPGRPPREPVARWWLCGCAAADGVLAAAGAAAGLTGDPGLLERGLGVDGAIVAEPERLRSGAPARVSVVETKPLCAARQVLAAVGAAQALHGRLPAGAADAVTVAVPAAYRAMVDRPAPADRVASLQSAQFQVAAALTGDSALYDPLRSPPRLGPEADRLMRVVQVVEDPGLSAGYPARWSGRVTVRLADGRELTELVAQAPGAAPASSWDQLTEKHALAGIAGAPLDAVRSRCQTLAVAGAGCARALLSVAVTFDGETPVN